MDTDSTAQLPSSEFSIYNTQILHALPTFFFSLAQQPSGVEIMGQEIIWFSERKPFFPSNFLIKKDLALD